MRFYPLGLPYSYYSWYNKMHSADSDASSHTDFEKAATTLSRQPPIDHEKHAHLAPSDADPYLVFLDADENPKSWSFLKKCVVVFVVSTGALCSTFASSVVSSPCACARVWWADGQRQAAFAEPGEAATFHVSKEVAILGVSLNVLGIGTFH